MPEFQKHLLHFFHAAGYSLKGLRSALDEMAFRQELLLFCVMFPLGLYLGSTPVERLLLVFPLFIVLMVELLNSAIESAIDLISPDHHPLAGKAKDLGSAAVFISLVAAGCSWLIILAEKFLAAG
ncbi:MAG: diacylglycerol kinase [Thermodesulfobacteriota bacterium]